MTSFFATFLALCLSIGMYFLCSNNLSDAYSNSMFIAVSHTAKQFFFQTTLFKLDSGADLLSSLEIIWVSKDFRQEGVGTILLLHAHYFDQVLLSLMTQPQCASYSFSRTNSSHLLLHSLDYPRAVIVPPAACSVILVVNSDVTILILKIVYLDDRARSVSVLFRGNLNEYCQYTYHILKYKTTGHWIVSRFFLDLMTLI